MSLAVKLFIIFYLVLLSAILLQANAAGSFPIRKPLGIRRVINRSPQPDCGDIGSKSQCLQTQKCRWCQSDAIDDSCFSKSEAFRLPSQVFVCNWLKPFPLSPNFIPFLYNTVSGVVCLWNWFPYQITFQCSDLGTLISYLLSITKNFDTCSGWFLSFMFYCLNVLQLQLYEDFRFLFFRTFHVR